LVVVVAVETGVEVLVVVVEVLVDFAQVQDSLLLPKTTQ